MATSGYRSRLCRALVLCLLSSAGCSAWDAYQAPNPGHCQNMRNLCGYFERCDADSGLCTPVSAIYKQHFRVPCDTAQLIELLRTRSHDSSVFVELTPACTYRFAAASDYLFGPNALPAIYGELSVEGHGATLMRASATPTGTSTSTSASATPAPWAATRHRRRWRRCRRSCSAASR